MRLGSTKRLDLPALAIVLGVLAFHAAFNAYYLSQDTATPGWDESYHLIQSSDYLRLMAGMNRDGPRQILTMYRYYPPFVYVATAPVYALAGWTDHTAPLVNIPFMAVALLSTYGTGRRLLGRWTGVLGAVLLSFFPSFFGLSRLYMLELGLIAMISLANYWALRTEFRRGRDGLVYGLLFALALLTKWTAPLFMVGPLAYVVFGRYAEARRAIPAEGRGHLNIAPIVPIVLAGAMALAVAGPWYITNATRLYHDLTGYLGGGDLRAGQSSTLDAWAAYPRALVETAVFLPLLLLTIPGMVYLATRARRAGAFFASIFLPAYIVLSSLSYQDERFILPALPVAAIVGVSWIVPFLRSPRISSVPRTVGIAALATVVVVAGIGFAVLTVGPGPLPAEVRLGGADSPWMVYSWWAQESHPIERVDWHVEDIVFTIDDHWGKTQPAYVTVLTNAYNFSAAAFTYYTNRHSLNLEFHKVAGEDTPYTTFEEQFQRSDFIVGKTGDLGTLFPGQQAQSERALAYIQASPTFLETFRPVAVYPLPDGNTATLYERIATVTS